MKTLEPSFYVTGGTLRHDSPSYVERKADKDLYTQLRQGEFCHVLTSRQMGKSSLMVRTARKLREQGIHVIPLDLTALGQNLTPEQWYDGLNLRIGQKLGLEDELDEFWIAAQRVGPVQRLFDGLSQVGLRMRPGALVIFVDEIDTVRSLPFSTDEFFAAIRECYNRRTEEPEFNRITFCLLGVATPTDLIKNVRITPFNVGRRIELSDFTVDEAAPLAEGLRWSKSEGFDAYDQAQNLLRRILYWTNGHPYLTQQLCRAVAESGGSRSVDDLCDELFLSNRARERDDNLIWVREQLLRSRSDRASLLDLYLQVRNGKSVVDDETNPFVSELRLSGIVKVQNGRLYVRNRIYHQVFDRDWVTGNMPGPELRRQKAAFRRGALRATGIAASVVLGLAVTLFYALKESWRADRESANAYVSQAEATRLQGKRFQTVEAIRKAVSTFPAEKKLQNLAIASLALMDLRLADEWREHPSGSTCAAFNQDFSFYALADPQGGVSIHRAQTGEEIARLGKEHSIRPNIVLFSPDSAYLAAGYKRDSTNELVVWRWRDRAMVLSTFDSPTLSFDFGPKSETIAVGRSDGLIQIYSLISGKPVLQLPSTLSTTLPRQINSLRFHPSSPLLAEASDSSFRVQIWDLESHQVTRSIYYPSQVRQLAWHPHGQMLAAGCTNGDIYLWSHRESREPDKILAGHESEVTQLAFSNQGDLLASFSADRTIRLWIPATSRHSIHTIGPGEIHLAFSSDDRHVGWQSINRQVRTWEVNPAREYRTLFDFGALNEPVEEIEFSSSGLLLAATGPDGITFWEPALGKKVGSISQPNTRGAQFHPVTGDLLVASSEGLSRWRLKPNAEPPKSRFRVEKHSAIQDPEHLGQPLGHITVSLDGKVGAVVRGDSVVIFDPATSAVHHVLSNQTYYHNLALSPAADFLAARHKQGNRIDIWNLVTRSLVQNNRALEGVLDFTFSPDGLWLAISTTELVSVWKVGTWQRGSPVPLVKPPSPIGFSHDGTILAVGNSPSKIELIRWPEGELLATLEGPDRKPLRSIVFSHDGRKLAALSGEQLIFIWDLPLLVEGLSELNLQHDMPTYSNAPPRLHPVELEIVP